MSHKTIVTCDLCKQDLEQGAQTWDVLLYAECGHQPVSPSGRYDTPRLRIEVCRPCLDKLGIIVQYNPKKETPQEAPSIEDMIREIVGNAVEELK